MTEESAPEWGILGHRPRRTPQGLVETGKAPEASPGTVHYSVSIKSLKWQVALKLIDPRKAEKQEGTTCHLGWLADVKGCDWRAGWGHLC